MSRRNLTALVLWMAGTLLSFSALAVAIRELNGILSAFEMLALRNAVGVAILLAIALARADLTFLRRPRRMGLQLTRNVVHFAGTYAWTVALTMLPLATAFAIEFTTPAWVALLAVVLLGERLSLPRAGAIALGFLGVLLIVRPGMGAFQPGALLMLGAAFAFAVTTVVTKALTRSESTFAILFWMNLMQLPMNATGLEAGVIGRVADAPLLPLMGLCIGGLSAHWCLTNAYRHGDAVAVVPLDFLRLPLIALIGWQLYAEPLDPVVFAGAALILTGILWNLTAEARRPAPA